MRKIILASRSKARKKILKDMGIKFQVFESRIKENKNLRKKSCRELVIKNALKKARDAASRYKSGVIIAADTVVLVGKRIIGKPKDMKDAFKTLKILSKRPQRVYTGLAVIDIDKRRTFTASEKTKVHMRKLTGKDIKNYFRRTSPMDKAGSFDIQGLGGIFIDRIEGCFYNVVGLPIAKLVKILKKAGIQGGKI